MPSALHEMLVAALRERPTVLATLLGDALSLGASPSFRPLDTVMANELVPPARAVDVALEATVGTERFNLLGEVQLKRDDEKRWAWPLYVAYVGARDRRRTILFVVTLDEATERWARTPVEWMNGCPFAPLVIGPSSFPILDDAQHARREPELALFSLVAHAHRLPEERARRLGTSWLASLDGLEPARRTWYADVAFAQLQQQHARSLMEFLMQPPANYEIQSEALKALIERGRREGLREGLRDGEVVMLLRLIERRFGTPDAAAVARLHAASDAELERVADRILSATTLAELFAERD